MNETIVQVLYRFKGTTQYRAGLMINNLLLLVDAQTGEVAEEDFVDEVIALNWTNLSDAILRNLPCE